MSPFQGLRGNRLNYVALIGVVMPAMISLGYNQGLLGGVLTMDWFQEQFPQIDVNDALPAERHRKSTLQGTVVALYAAGGLLGALACIGIGDTIGRRRTIRIATVIHMIGAFLGASSFNLAQLVASRVILGLGCGGQLATVPIWQSEISPAKKRGAHVGMTGVFIGLGLTLALLMDLGMSFVDRSVSWRLPLALPIVLCIPILMLTSRLPESPRWLVQRGQFSEAREVIARFRHTSPDTEVVEKEIQDVLASLAIAGEGSFARVFQMGHQRVLHRASLAVGGLVLLQLTGINCITFYSTTLFQTHLHLNPLTSRILGAGFQLSGTVGGVVCAFTIDGFGRRFLMLLSAIANTVCMILVAGLSSPPTNAASNAAVAFMFIFHFSVNVGFGGIPFLYASEVAPLSLRTTITGISSAIWWGLSVLIALVTPIAFNAIEWKYFIIFAALNAGIIPVIYYIFPETAGLTLEDVDEVFITSSGVFDSVRVAKRMKQTSGKARAQENTEAEKGKGRAPMACESE
ncbi:unnamed protein product [Penicillium olsonii]|uniref:Major facilitator superfamily (MFS) profile domain-containing protein n=1 Tax=Penicillium olsonii TaxID=99116 RepID=A0A9W4HMC6_PENOL|nr:unnamed protein product [Penicillium olsonii]CAG8094438.1 unnamed protein product [Penicillium olsonii]CAG8290150.1 unnamed protein product [Penicillium olsonii]